MTEKTPVLHFVYSYPYEGTLLKISGKKLTQEYSQEAIRKVSIVQKIWNKYEKRVLMLFQEIYKIEIPEKYIKAYISLILPGSYSDPLTISLKHWSDIEDNSRSQRGVVYTIIHELAHYFAYTRSDSSYFNKIHSKTQKIDIFKSHGANLHYLIQAVEFGIIGEIFGNSYAEYARNWVIENWPKDEYGLSAKALKKDNIPFNKTCLEHIEKGVLKFSVLIT